MVYSALEKVPGIEKIMVNVPLKNVIVDHDCELMSAADIKSILDENHFEAIIQRDGGKSRKSSSQSRSSFYVENICCASEIPAINSILTPLDGVTKVRINVTTKMVKVGSKLGLRI
jgi:copper chaperone CopZ